MAKKETLKDNVLARLTSRKLWVTIAAMATALGAALADGTVSVAEVWTVIAPALGYVGVEGARDIKNA